jgi:hypothetical protein
VQAGAPIADACVCSPSASPTPSWSLRQAQGRLCGGSRPFGKLRAGGRTAVDVDDDRGERFFIYACKAKATPPVPIWSDDLRAGTPTAWIELAEQVKLIEPELLRGAMLRTVVIVGEAIAERLSGQNARARLG